MKKYRVTIAEGLTYHQYVTDILAGSEEEAARKAKEAFDHQLPIYSAHSKVIMCSLVL